MSEANPHPSPSLDVPRLDTSSSFAKEAYAALKRAITAMDIYDHPQEIRLDERRLSEGLGVSRTPIREAMTLLEQEGFVRTRPRRGIFVVRKTKREIVEMITVMAALESMAARLAAERASGADIAELRRLMDAFRAPYGKKGGERLAEYSDANIAFHQAIIKMSGSALLAEMTENLFIHMRAIRKITIHQENRAARSITDHFGIIEALECRDPELAERLAREHTLGLAAHVEQHGDFLDTTRDDEPDDLQVVRRSHRTTLVAPVKAGVQSLPLARTGGDRPGPAALDSRFRRKDDKSDPPRNRGSRK
jgi:DNA-binding GntR family transcriptional regulator